MKSLFLPSAAASIRYYDIEHLSGPHAKQPVLVFLAGQCTSVSSLLQTAMHSCIRGPRSILIDYLGTGFSDKPADFDHTMDSHAKTIAAVLDHEGIEKCCLVGHSMGGTVALLVALSRPDLVGRLVMSESNLEPGGGTGSRAIANVDERGFVTTNFPAMLDTWRQQSAAGDKAASFHFGFWSVADARAIHRQAVSLVGLEPSLMRRYLALPIPRGFIIGEQNDPRVTGKRLPDTPFPDELAPHGVLVRVVPDSGHFFMVDNPGGYAVAIADCLAHLGRPSAL
jgi:pimeloyl-ACP methyl ester carboxylesterase